MHRERERDARAYYTMLYYSEASLVEDLQRQVAAVVEVAEVGPGHRPGRAAQNYYRRGNTYSSVWVALLVQSYLSNTASFVLCAFARAPTL